MSESEEYAKAMAKTVELGITAIETTNKATGFIAKYIDEPLSELAGKWVDNKKFDRWENQVKIQDKVNAKLKEKGCKTKRMIPPKLGIPLIDNALSEDDDDLREIWCNLIANSLDPNFDMEIRYAFIEIIKNLTTLDAKILKYMFETTYDMVTRTETSEPIYCTISADKIKENTYVVGRELEISLYNLMRLQCISDNNLVETVIHLRRAVTKLAQHPVEEHTYQEAYVLTPLGQAFIEACIISSLPQPE